MPQQDRVNKADKGHQCGLDSNLTFVKSLGNEGALYKCDKCGQTFLGARSQAAPQQDEVREQIKIRMADDACLFCGRHGEHAGGHLFIGKRQENGDLLSDTGWICIEHLVNCAVQICPACAKKLEGFDPAKLTLIGDEEIRAALSKAMEEGQLYGDDGEPLPEKAVAQAQLAHTKRELNVEG